MTEAQITWAATHDWFLRAHNGVAVCLDTVIDRNGRWSQVVVTFNNFSDLREWAGY